MRGARLLAVLASAALHTLAFPPWHAWPLAWVALVPLLVVLYGGSPARGAAAGLLWGSAAVWGVGWWVAPAVSVYYEQPWWFGVLFCVVGCVILWGSHYAVFGALAAWLAPRLAGPARALVVAALWVACEFARARLVMDEPWMQLGYALTDVPVLIQIADLGSVPLLSFVVALVNASLAELVVARGRALRVGIGPAIAVVATLAYGAYRLGETLPAGPSVPIAVVQGNNELRTQWRREFYGDGLDRYLRLSRGGAVRPRLLVWPESAVTFFLAEEPAYAQHIGRVLGALDAELVVGGPYREPAGGGFRFYNSAFRLDPRGVLQERYDKARLLPFGEYFPLRFAAFLARHFEQVRNFAPGDGAVLLETRAGRAAVVICFEAIFPELVRERMRRGAELLVNLSNDVWLGGGPGPAQHLQMVVLRAVEVRTWVVRATTTGISAVIDPRGRVRARTPFGVEAMLEAEVSPMRIGTVYETAGDVFAWACVAVVFIAGMLGGRRKP